VLSGEKILITGPAGRIGYGLTAALAEDNEVWGIARFSDPQQRQEIDALGVTTQAVDLLTCELGDLPGDFTYLLHIAANFEDSTYDRAIQINAEATGFLLEHCRRVKAALVMSSLSVYKPHLDPWHPYREDEPLGDTLEPIPASYSISKIGSEIVARYCARSLDIPLIIARMGAAYNEHGGLPALHAQRIADERPITVRWDPLPYSVIHGDDVADQLEALLDAASTPATILNWCGDQPVSVQEWAPFLADLLGCSATIETAEPVPGASRGVVGDTTRRRAITGLCKVHWKDGFRRMAESLYPDRVGID
jgi:nucleoside-diphosphate-sugar epimerase